MADKDREIAELRRVQQELRESEERYRLIVESAFDAIVTIDHEGFITEFNPAAETVFGWKRSEVVGRELAEVIIPAAMRHGHRAGLARHRDSSQAPRLGVRLELPALHSDGSEFPIELTVSRVAGGGLPRFTAIIRDITETRRAEQALLENQRALAALMGNLPGMAYRCRNDAGWTLDFVSEGAHKLTGHRPEAIVSGKVSYANLIHPDDRARVRSEVQAAIAQDRVFQFTYRIITAKGTLKWVWERGSAVRGANAEVVALEGFVSDITDRRQAQEEVARLNCELEERVRERTAQLEAANAELEAFSYSIAHDLRSPLTSIDGFSHMLDELASKTVDEQGRHYLRRIRAGVRQMSDLTDAMLSLARLSRVELMWEEVDLAEIGRKVEASLREREPQRTAVFELPNRLYAHGDPRLLAQVVSNLVGNAWKFSAGSPHASIRLGSQAGDDGEPVYFVADNGAGFDMAHASRLFGAFQRLHTPSEFEGTGIGLALVQKIISRHGGRIWAEASPGHGATFYFTLPTSSDS